MSLADTMADLGSAVVPLHSDYAGGASGASGGSRGRGPDILVKKLLKFILFVLIIILTLLLFFAPSSSASHLPASERDNTSF